VPTPLIGCLVAIALAGLVAALTPALLRWCPVPPDEPEELEIAPFSDLATPGFRWAVFVVATLAGAVAFGLTAPGYWLAWAPLAGLGALLALVDLRTTFLPLRLNYLALGIALAGTVVAAWAAGDGTVLLWAAGGGLGAAALFWIGWRVGALGFGDVRLAGLIGVVAGTGGPVQLAQLLLFGSIAGCVWAIVVRLRRGAGAEFAYGPSLLLGPFLVLIVQQFLPAH
jgi:leader peptidase (prepilin peptidase)/N-methyltransferase